MGSEELSGTVSQRATMAELQLHLAVVATGHPQPRLLLRRLTCRSMRWWWAATQCGGPCSTRLCLQLCRMRKPRTGRTLMLVALVEVEAAGSAAGEAAVLVVDVQVITAMVEAAVAVAAMAMAQATVVEEAQCTGLAKAMSTITGHIGRHRHLLARDHQLLQGAMVARAHLVPPADTQPQVQAVQLRLGEAAQARTEATL